MKSNILLISLALLLTGGLVSCSNPLGEMEKSRELAAKVPASTHHTYSEIPGVANQVFAAEIRQYNDGTIEVIRSIVPRNPSMELATVFTDASSIQISSSGNSFSLLQNGWYISYDPSIQAIAIGGGVKIELECYCDANGTCIIQGNPLPDGKYNFGCESWNCMGNCDGRVIIHDGDDRLQVGNGMFISASSVQVF